MYFNMAGGLNAQCKMVKPQQCMIFHENILCMFLPTLYSKPSFEKGLQVVTLLADDKSFSKALQI